MVQTRNTRAGRPLVWVLAVALATACGSTPEGPGPDGGSGDPGTGLDLPDGPDGVGGPAEVIVELPPFPDRFLRNTLLVADQVVIEGPKGLLDHVALGQDDELLDYSVETLPIGFRQVLSKKPGGDFVQIRAGLDAWEITALQRVMVLERPGDVPVRIVAAGNVWFRSLDARGPIDGGPIERRGERLEFRSE
ncbi:MAG: hypothetical protein P1V81_09980 [Planctomycetota bacterium]|nr:hypothetical protein [Planctomycetota bacterium]